VTVPSIEQHLTQATLNEAVAAMLAENQSYDWAVTALFYAALHKVQAYLARSDLYPTSHSRREKVLASRPETEPLGELYMLLRTRSEDARYNCLAFSQAEYARLKSIHYQRLLATLGTLDGGYWNSAASTSEDPT
jgi:uncharacterized protein (UPF0332 family)